MRVEQLLKESQALAEKLKMQTEELQQQQEELEQQQEERLFLYSPSVPPRTMF